MISNPLILAIETSCDETAVAILAQGQLRASVVASQVALHQPFGGVVPEIASRNHLTQLKPLITAALQKAGLKIAAIDAFAATAGPGLASSLMLGVSAAKGLSLSTDKPFLAVNHLEGHLLSPFFSAGKKITPAIGLIVSGGHTLLVELEAFGKYRLLGQTRDDAAGEAFDKVGKLLGLPYPAGPHVDRVAQTGDPARFNFPRGLIDSGDLSFSFSGLKTAVRYFLPKTRAEDLSDLCASFQEAVIDVLVKKTIAAVKQTNRSCVAVSGGVSCNSRLRTKLAAACAREKIELLLAAPELCTDNAAMIAFVAAEKFAAGDFSPLTMDIDPNLRLVNSDLR